MTACRAILPEEGLGTALLRGMQFANGFSSGALPTLSSLLFMTRPAPNSAHPSPPGSPPMSAS